MNNAFLTYARALQEDPNQQVTRDELDRIAASVGAWEPLAQVYETQAKSVEDPLVLVSLHGKAAQIREEQLGDIEGAITHYKRVLDVDATNLEAASAKSQWISTRSMFMR